MTNSSNLSWKDSPKSGQLIGKKIILETNWINAFTEKHILSNGITHDFTIIHAPDWVIIVPVDRDGFFIMIWQYRPAWQRASLEFPAGRLEPNETLENSVIGAKRELREESGYRATNWKYLGRINPITWTVQQTDIFLASDLALGETDFDPTEDIEIEKVHPDIFWEKVERGDIIDGPSIASYSYWKKYHV